MIVLKILQFVVGVVFSFYIYKALLGKLDESDWPKAIATLVAVFVLAFIGH